MAYSDTQIKETVRSLAESPNPSIQESQFIAEFLPMFSADPRNVEGKIFVNAWINISNSPFAEVDVMRGNERLFTVPPILHTPESLLSVLDKSEAYKNITQAALKYNVMPKLGEAHMQRWMDGTIPKQEVAFEHVRRWNDIFKRYNLPTIPLPDDKQVQEKPATADLGGFEYEDF